MQEEEGQCLSPAARSGTEGRAEDELDFESDLPADESADRPVDKSTAPIDEEKGCSGEDGEVDGESDEGQVEEDEDLEEGELKEDEDEASAGTDVCKYYSRGSCTWGDECRFQHQSGQTGLRRNIPPLRPPANPIYVNAPTGQPMAGLKGPPIRPFYAPAPLLSDPVASSWEQGLRSAKERVAKAKERKESESDFDDKRLNLTSPEDVPLHRPTSSRNAYPPRDSGGYASKADRRSSPGDQRYSYHSASHHQHYSSPSYYQSRDYRPQSHSQSHDESEYERRQRLAYQAAPRPEEWSHDRSSQRSGPLLDRYGREIRITRPPDHYVDKYRRSPVQRPIEKPARESGDLSSISNSDSPSGLSGTSSESDSWSDDVEQDHRRKNDGRTKPAPAALPPNSDSKPVSTSGMRRIPRIGERQQVRDNRPSPKRTHVMEQSSREEFSSSRSKVPHHSKERDSSRSFRSSLSSGSDDAEFERLKSEKRRANASASASDPLRDPKRRRESHHSDGSHSPVSPPNREFSPPENLAVSPRREKERFVMDFGKSQRIRPTGVAETLSRLSSDEDEDDDEEDGEGSGKRSGSGGENSVDKAAERKKLLEQLKAVEAAIAAKKQPLKAGRRKM